jgi:hypothetical protein
LLFAISKSKGKIRIKTKQKQGKIRIKNGLCSCFVFILIFILKKALAHKNKALIFFPLRPWALLFVLIFIPPFFYSYFIIIKIRRALRLIFFVYKKN